MVSEWRSVIAVSSNVGGGVRLIKPAKLHTCARKTLQTQRGRTHGAGCVRQWFRTAEPLGNVVTRIGTQTGVPSVHFSSDLANREGISDDIATVSLRFTVFSVASSIATFISAHYMTLFFHLIFCLVKSIS